MQAILKFRWDRRPWTRKFDRLGVAVRRAPAVHIVAPGQEAKVEAAERRGDRWPSADESYMRACRELLVGGIAELANNGGTSLREVMDQIGAHLAEGVAEQITSGGVVGPQRSAAWVRRKGHDVNLLGLTGDLGGNIQHRLVNR